MKIKLRYPLQLVAVLSATLAAAAFSPRADEPSPSELTENDRVSHASQQFAEELLPIAQLEAGTQRLAVY